MTQSLDRIGQVAAYRNTSVTNDAMLLDRIGQAAAYRNSSVTNNAMLVDRIGMVIAIRYDDYVLIVPNADVTTGTWKTETGGTTNLYTKISESFPDNTTYIQSDINPSGDLYKASLSAPVPNVGDDVVIDYTLGKRVGGSRLDYVLNLKQGTTLIKTWSHTDVPEGPTAYNVILSQAEVDSITDFSSLSLEIIPTAV